MFQWAWPKAAPAYESTEQVSTEVAEKLIVFRLGFTVEEIKRGGRRYTSRRDFESDEVHPSRKTTVGSFGSPERNVGARRVQPLSPSISGHSDMGFGPGCFYLGLYVLRQKY
ncbi:hypothetical protein Rs2_41206 [Raphanus sativus]|nr:hypothetical protein Rs2_41206 [Raphanus sativus]